MGKDFREERMDSAEGLGKALRVWTGWSESVGLERPAAWDRAFARIGEKHLMEMYGFWLTWQLFGGFEGMRRAGWSRATIYRHLKRFRTQLKSHPDEFRLAGVEIQHAAFWEKHLLPELEDEG